MIIEPKIRGFICTTAHPQGCFKAVEQQINFVKAQQPIQGPKNVLIIGSSTGYGLASRIVATFAANAKTIGVFFEKRADEKRTASPGWYNSAAFETFAHKAGFYAKSINGDAFSQSIKEQTAALIEKDLKQIDLIIYSLASPRRIHPITGQVYQSTLKSIGESFVSKTVDPLRGDVKEVSIDQANQNEIANTVAVMGGEDWSLWINYLKAKNLLAPNVKTIAYSYIGPPLTHAIYKNGTIGKAKEHLKKTADQLNQELKQIGGEAIISVNKAVVTQASAAIPVVPLYISLLFKLMKAKGTHEGCIEQIYRLFKDYLYVPDRKVDIEGYIRIDDLEMDETIQQQIMQVWPLINTENLSSYTDIEGYKHEFYNLFGFKIAGVDYTADSEPDIKIPSVDS